MIEARLAAFSVLYRTGGVRVVTEDQTYLSSYLGAEQFAANARSEFRHFTFQLISP